MRASWLALIGLILIGFFFNLDPAGAVQKKNNVKPAATKPVRPANPAVASVDPSLVFGKTGDGPGEFKTIDGVWVDPRGRIVVADKGNNRINFFTGGGRFLTSFGEPGTGPGQFDRCTGVVVDRQRRVIVSDQGNYRIQVFDLEGNFLTAFGRQGNGDGEFQEPMGLALDEQGNLYVADGTRDDIQIFDEKFRFVRKFGLSRPGFGRMEMIESVSISVGPPTRQEVYVSDEKNSRIHRFSAEGTHLGSFGKQGTGPGMFIKEVEGLAFDPFGYLYAVDESGGKMRFSPRTANRSIPSAGAWGFARGSSTPRTDCTTVPCTTAPGGRSAEPAGPDVPHGRHLEKKETGFANRGPAAERPFKS